MSENTQFMKTVFTFFLLFFSCALAQPQSFSLISQAKSYSIKLQDDILPFNKTSEAKSYNIKPDAEPVINAQTVDNQAPIIRVIEPLIANNGIDVSGNELTFTIAASDISGVKYVSINGQRASLVNDDFTKTLTLSDNDKTIVIKAADKSVNMNEATLTLELRREVITSRGGPDGVTVQVNSTSSGTNVTYKIPNKQDVTVSYGKYYALLIYESNYQDFGSGNTWKDLLWPQTDIQKVQEVLSQNYTFEEKNITQLKNPNRGEIIGALEKLANQLTEHDNLLIYYAGHGTWKDDKKEGYWIPCDSKKSTTANWISNSDLISNLRGFTCKHILLVSDACFSGGIFKGKDNDNFTLDQIANIYKKKSRRAITSGSMESVPDKSQFNRFFVKYLKDNTYDVYYSRRLFTDLYAPVSSNTNTVPDEGPLKEADDEGGDFIFIKK